MLKAIAVIAAVLVVAGAIVLILAATKPDEIRVQRTATIRAPAEKIFPMIADFQKWRGWSPYEEKDPAMKRTYEGAPNGKGAIYAWDGDKNVASGRMEILDAPAPSKVVIKLDFFTPFEGHNTAVFTMLPQGDGTHVTWLMHGPANFMSKIVQVFIDLDNMIGRDFEAGLAKLKQVAEK